PAAPAAPVPAPPRTAPRKVAKAEPRAERALRMGSMKVTAPDEAEVFLDGRRVGKGNVSLAVTEGAHRIEVRLGKAKVQERFTVAGGETWTYDVTPTR
ncbi:MAG TPA: PEGA domain-containing protein, partial [Anaeromyxobacteraceae bacterium]|nr:PEGA domain-containing protein [Anaeromyxobacteraceae bacterium]